jgi:PAS domain-containing protein
MSADSLGLIIPRIHDAALDPRLWTSVLGSVTEALGAVGAAYIVRNARTGRVDWANFLGPSAQFTSDYITRYAAKDPFVELLTNHEGVWIRLSEQLPAPELHRNEWYTGFVLKSGVKDIVAAQISNTGSHRVVFGIHEGIGEKPLPISRLKRLNRLLEPLRRAAEVQLRLRELGWKSAVVARAFDQVSTGVIVVDSGGSVIEMNGLAERVVRRATVLRSSKARSARRAYSRPPNLQPRLHRRRNLNRRRRAAASSSAGRAANTTTFSPSRPSASSSASTRIRWPSSSSWILRRDAPTRTISRPISDCPSRNAGLRCGSCRASRCAPSRRSPAPRQPRCAASCVLS